MKRLFVAVDLPDAVKSAVALLRFEHHGARWVAAEQIHLTMRFIGEVGEECFAAAKAALSAIKASPFPLRVCRVGYFPPGKHPRVLWVGLEQSEPLVQLYGQIELALMEAGIDPESRSFSPHITIARLNEIPIAAITSFQNEHRGFSCEEFMVERFVLYSSLLSRSGAIHTKEAVYELAV